MCWLNCSLWTCFENFWIINVPVFRWIIPWKCSNWFAYVLQFCANLLLENLLWRFGNGYLPFLKKLNFILMMLIGQALFSCLVGGKKCWKLKERIIWFLKLWWHCKSDASPHWLFFFAYTVPFFFFCVHYINL